MAGWKNAATAHNCSDQLELHRIIQSSSHGNQIRVLRNRHNGSESAAYEAA